MPTLMLVGIGLFFLGVAGVMGLLFSNGGADKSQQFAVLGKLWAGKFGNAARNGIRASLVSAVTGAVLCFAGVGQMDAARAQRCQDYCVVQGFAKGAIGPSAERSKETRFVACLCTAPDRQTLELRADSLRP